MRSEILATSMLMLLGCSLSRVDRTECVDHGDCREVFGLGSTCDANGYCEAAAPRNRCTRTYPGDLLLRSDAYPDVILIGSLFDQSLATHRARENAIRLAFRAVNSEGGLEGRSFAVVFCSIAEDDEFDALTRTEAAVEIGRYLTRELGAVALLGPASSGDTKAVFEALGPEGVLIVSPSATSPILTDLDTLPASDDEPGLLWRTAPPDSLQGQAIARDMRTAGDGRSRTSTVAAVILEEGAYGESLAGVFEREFSALGGTSILSSYASEAQRDEAIASAVDEDVDEVLFVSSQTQDAIAFLSGARTIAGYEDLPLFLTDSAANADFVANVDPGLIDQVRGTRQAPQKEEDNFVFRLFLAAYSAEYGEDARDFSFTANAFDAAWLIAYASAWALYQEPALDGVALARGLRRLSEGAPLELRASNWSVLKERFREGQSVDVQGASSPLDFDPVTEEMAAAIETWIVEEGEIRGVRTFIPQQD